MGRFARPENVMGRKFHGSAAAGRVSRITPSVSNAPRTSAAPAQHIVARALLPARSCTPAAAASTNSSPRFTSAGDCHLSSGSFARHCRMMRSTPAGAPVVASAKAGASAVMIAEITLAALSPPKAAGEHFVEHQPEREDVGARIGGFALQLLRRHVLQRALDGAVGGHGYGGGFVAALELLPHLRQYEIEQLDAVLRDHDVGGFEVAMDDALAVSGIEGVQNLARERQGARPRQRPAQGLT